jgi:hypothetical protein
MQISTQILQQATAPQSVFDWFTSVFAEATVNEQDTLDAAREGAFADFDVYTWFQDNLFLEGGALFN